MNKNILSTVVTIACAVGLSACSSNTNSAANPGAYKGNMVLENAKVGIPEATIKEAILTFVQDPKGSNSGKTQYLSRGYNKNGGQYMIHCANGTAFGVEVIHPTQPVTKEVAMETIKVLLPEGAPEQSKVDDSEVKAANHREAIYFGDKYRVDVIYNDADGKNVTAISAWQADSPIAPAPPKG